MDIVFFSYSFIHYGQLHDVQTLAMLACICQLQCCNVDRHFESKFKSYQDLSHTVTPSLYKKTQVINCIVFG